MRVGGEERERERIQHFARCSAVRQLLCTARGNSLKKGQTAVFHRKNNNREGGWPTAQERSFAGVGTLWRVVSKPHELCQVSRGVAVAAGCKESVVLGWRQNGWAPMPPFSLDEEWSSLDWEKIVLPLSLRVSNAGEFFWLHYTLCMQMHMRQNGDKRVVTCAESTVAAWCRAIGLKAWTLKKCKPHLSHCLFRRSSSKPAGALLRLAAGQRILLLTDQVHEHP